MARKKEFDQGAVLDKALHQFWEQGYEATSVRDLIQVMGISSSSLYDTFGEKHAVYLAALSRFRQMEHDQVAGILAQPEPAAMVLESWFAETIDMVLAGNGPSGSFSLNAAVELGTQDPEVAGELREHFDDIGAMLSGYLSRAQERGDISTAHDPQALAQYFLSVLFGLYVLMKTYPNRRLAENIAKVTLSVLDKEVLPAH